MRDYIRRFIIAGIMALCVSLLFLGGKPSKAAEQDIRELTEHWIWPADGVITDTFGTRKGHHKGIDIAAEAGSPVYAVDNGVVTKSYYSESYGQVIFIKHSNNTETVYAHMNERLAGEGEKVKQGDKIGTMGSTGDSSGVHLHFEVHKKEWTFNKENALDPSVAFGNEDVGQPVHVLMNEEKTREVSAPVAKFENGAKEGTGSSANAPSMEEGKSEDTVHIVQPGETLWTIAGKYDLSVNDIVRLNNVRESKIVPQQKLIIETGNRQRYTVKKGDTLTSIAIKHQTTTESIKQTNKLNSDLIKIGQLLLIRQKQ